MFYGRRTPPGHLPVYSVDTEEEAEQLLTAACETNYEGEYVARELAEEQTIDNLAAFSERLHRVAQRIGLDEDR